jgi:serine phosphatase RsbU (regulator of sigma subunit)
MSARAQSNGELDRRKVESLTKELLTVWEELSLLYSLAGQLGRLVDEEQIVSVALREALTTLAADCGWVAFCERECCAATGISVETAQAISSVAILDLKARGKTQAISHSIAGDWNLRIPGAPERLLACAIPGGYICVGRAAGARIFTSVDQKLLFAVSSLAGMSLENIRLQQSETEKRRLAHELELARRIQESLLPADFACVPFVEAAGIAVPCYEIGGDYFDLAPFGDDRCLLGIADVAGKGPPAALRAAMVHGVIHAARQQSCTLPQLMSMLNRCIAERASGVAFVTGFMALLDAAGRLTYSNAGHNAPLLIRGTGEIETLKEGGPLWGFLPSAPYRCPEVRLSPGDALLLYTDGVTDAENAASQEFGEDRLLEWARRQAGQSPDAIQASLIDTLRNFCGHRPHPDDLTFLVARYRA